MPGAGGGLAYNHVVSERSDDGDLIVAASSATTLSGQNAYAGMTADQVRFVGAIGADPGVIVVAADSRSKLWAIWLRPSKPIPVPCVRWRLCRGRVDHLKPLMILKRAAFTDITKVKYIALTAAQMRSHKPWVASPKQ
ncbi:Hypothetical protein FKW44_016301 [Caligus rogercresseyi]|uniref:Uncharacterized protein n=1 Tax=Caligus rogercresseyi TaxID=217165 RepID=A0A7T8H2A0_CALRO|nr:Hypothetical protein FKW44_016301 [Caligus rogercresseyi]